MVIDPPLFLIKVFVFRLFRILEIRSWLMMATELVPSTIPDTDKPPSSDLIQNNVECMVCLDI